MTPSRILALVGATLLCGAASAQEITLADGTPIPRPYPLPVPLLRVYVAAEGLPGRTTPQADSPPVPGVTFEFMQPAYVAQFVPNRENPRQLLLASKDDQGRLDRALGWVDAEVVLRTNEAMKDLKTTIHRKAMIVNTMAALKEMQARPPEPLFRAPVPGAAAALRQGQFPEGLRQLFENRKIRFTDKVKVEPRQGSGWLLIDAPERRPAGAVAGLQRFEITEEARELVVRDSLGQAPVYLSPYTQTRAANFMIFNVFFVYAETNGHLLLGSNQQFTDSSARETIQGWVPVTRLSSWNTREAVEWDRRSTLSKPEDRTEADGTLLPRRSRPAHLFENVNAASEWLTRLQTPGETAASLEPELRRLEQQGFYKETFDKLGVSREWHPDEFRFPLVGVNKPEHYPKLGTRLYRVGAAGPFLGSGGAVGKEQIDAEVRRIQNTIREFKTVEILFVIDDTTDMLNHRQDIGAAVRAVLESAVALREVPEFWDLRLRVAVSYYADDPAGKVVLTQPLEDVITATLGSKAIRSNVDRIYQSVAKHTFRQGGADVLEQVYRGIGESQQGARFTDTARRLVVVIGNMGDHAKEGAKREDSENQLTEELIVNSGATPIEFQAIQVGPRAEDGIGEQQLFKDQMEALCTRFNQAAAKRLGVGGIAVAHFSRAYDADALRTFLQKRYERLRQELEQARAQATALAEGQWHTTPLPWLREHLRTNGINVDELAQRDGLQVYQEGFVWERGVAVPGTPWSTGQRFPPQIRPKYKLSDVELQQLTQLLKGITSATTAERTDPNLLRALVSRLLKELTGEGVDVSRLSPEEYFSKVAGLRFQSPLLRKPPNVIEGISQKDRRDLLLKYRRLQDLLDGVSNEWVIREYKDPAGDTQYRAEANPARRREYRRAFQFPGGTTNWYWVDGEDEIP